MQPAGYAPFYSNYRLITSLFDTRFLLCDHTTVVSKHFDIIKAHVGVFHRSAADPGVEPNLELSCAFPPQTGSAFFLLPGILEKLKLFVWLLLK